MKKIKVLVVAAIAILTMVLAIAFAGCGASIEGIYAQDATKNSGNSEAYKLELYSDGTYQLTYRQWFALGPDLGLTYGRDVTSYGSYEVTAEDTELGTKTVSLAAPERMQLVAYHRNAILVSVDTEAWPGVTEDNEEGGISYVLFERAETETWTTAESFIAAYGKTYSIVCDATGSMQVSLGEGQTQIPLGAVPAAA